VGFSETIRSNRSDERGVIRHSIHLPLRSSLPDEAGNELGLSDTNLPPPSEHASRLVPLISERPAVLPKLRSKRLDARLLAGVPQSLQGNASMLLSGQFIPSNQTTTHDTGQRPVRMLEPQEYFFIVLTKRPERFTSLQSADWIRPPLDESQSNLVRPGNYRLLIPASDGLLTLPETMLDWTSTAVVLWDDLEPSALTVEQTRSLLDWLHFGGRMIINGPAMGTELSRSRFGAVMPMTIERNIELDAAAVEQLLTRWSVSGDNTTEQQAAVARQRSGRLLTEGPIHPAAVAIRDTGDLIVSRQIGGGQIIVSRFDLTSDWMLSWRSRDSFFNAALLGRPARKYETADESLVQRYVGSLSAVRADASQNSMFRLLARDGRLVTSSPEESASIDANSAEPREYVSHPMQGVGGWRDDSDLARLIVETLRSESGIVIPPRSFVIQSLSIFLFVLVPLNYVVFRLLGRLEWAWLAVPVIGLFGAAWIARGASLDVGLARSRTEISLAELHSDYPRAHVTRFISLYNSLSRHYDLTFDSPDAAAAPLGVLGQVKVNADEREPATVRYGYADGPILTGVAVASNRTRLFHTEQMLEMGGALRLTEDGFRNGTTYDLLDCWLIRRADSGEVSVANLGRCESGTRNPVRWMASEDVMLPQSLPLETQRVMKPLLHPQTLPPGAIRLVARCETAMPGLIVTPEPAQQSFATVVVAHMKRPIAVVAAGDQNLMPDRLEKLRRQRLEAEAVEF